ncbi:MAG: tetratricopeptide repeat protein [Fidelibacterota bacterium]
MWDINFKREIRGPHVILNRTILAVAMAILAGLIHGQHTAEELLHAGMYREEVEGHLEGAIKIYDEVLKQFPSNRPACAWAQLHLGICYEKLGDARAIRAYEEVVRLYADQQNAVEIAMSRLDGLSRKTPEYPPLVAYYIDRVGMEMLGALSPDGKLEAHTDWTTGNLFVKHRETGEVTFLTHKTWDDSPEFAYYKVFSPDGRKIAYGWSRGGWFVDLRVISVDGGDPEIIFQREGWGVFPTDWSPDGKDILVRITEEDSQDRLATVSLGSGHYRELTLLALNSRGLKFSPDGQYVVYDQGIGDKKPTELYILSMEDLENHRITPKLRGHKSTPIWSPDGKQVQFRLKTESATALMSLPISNGKPSGVASVVEMDIHGAMLTKAGIDPAEILRMVQQMRKQALMQDKPSVAFFDEEFDPLQLDPAWQVVEWKGPNAYGFKNAGWVSLTDNPGHLRFYVGPMTQPAGAVALFAGPSDYWYYPALELRRKLGGRNWILETKVNYNLPAGADSRGITLRILINPEDDTNAASLAITRGHTWGRDPKGFTMSFGQNGEGGDRASKYISLPGDTGKRPGYTCRFRISRTDTMVVVEMSEDDHTYQLVLSGKLRPETPAMNQQMVLSGTSWFTPAGFYADWDFFRFRQVDTQMK